MAYTIIEVERKTGVASRTLRFWADKGLFPFVQKDSNGVRYFSEKDVQGVLDRLLSPNWYEYRGYQVLHYTMC